MKINKKFINALKVLKDADLLAKLLKKHHGRKQQEK